MFKSSWLISLSLWTSQDLTWSRHEKFHEDKDLWLEISENTGHRAQVNMWWITTSSSRGQSTYQCILCGGRPCSRQYWSLIAAFRVKGYLSLAADGSVQCTRQRSGGCLEEVNFIYWMCWMMFRYQWSGQLFAVPVYFSVLPIRTQEIPKALF